MLWISVILTSVFGVTVEQACMLIADKSHLVNHFSYHSAIIRNPNLDEVYLRWKMAEHVFYQCVNILTPAEASSIRYQGMLDILLYPHVTKVHHSSYQTEEDIAPNPFFEKTRERIYADMEAQLDGKDPNSNRDGSANPIFMNTPGMMYEIKTEYVYEGDAEEEQKPNPNRRTIEVKRQDL